MRTLAMFILLAGCALLTPRTASLQHVHRTYTDEWSTEFLPEAGVQRYEADPDAFERTLAAIKNHRARFADEPHLTVLEGMIYVQTQRTAMARLLEDDVRRAGDALGARLVTRDVLFARAFPHLVDGWEEVGDALDNDETTRLDPDVLEGAADGLLDVLGQVPEDARPAVDLDSGGAYIATTAAILYLWVAAARSLDAEARGPLLAKARDGLAPFLTEAERANVGGRRRYAAWYAWLSANSP